jgi:hypothetical protein
MIEYTKKQIGESTAYEITTSHNGEELNFVCVVASSEDELDGLVEFHLDSIEKSKIPPVPTYSQLRQQEYPPVTDYIDGVVKGDQAQIDAYIAACQAVKAKYPKPEGN